MATVRWTSMSWECRDQQGENISDEGDTTLVPSVILTAPIVESTQMLRVIKWNVYNSKGDCLAYNLAYVFY